MTVCYSSYKWARLYWKGVGDFDLWPRLEIISCVTWSKLPTLSEPFSQSQYEMQMRRNGLQPCRSVSITQRNWNAKMSAPGLYPQESWIPLRRVSSQHLMVLWVRCTASLQKALSREGSCAWESISYSMNLVWCYCLCIFQSFWQCLTILTLLV